MAQDVLDITWEGRKTHLFPGSLRYKKVTKSPYEEQSVILFGSPYTGGTHQNRLPLQNQEFDNFHPLDPYKVFGECKVFDLTRCRDFITREDLQQKHIHPGDRILLKTQNSLRSNESGGAYAYVCPDFEATLYLKEKGISLLGVDGLAPDNKIFFIQDTHRRVRGNGIVLFEGLDLRTTEEGNYLFFGMPLMKVREEGTPARAVLMPL